MRRGRRTGPRPKTIAVKNISRKFLKANYEPCPDDSKPRPTTRAGCCDVPRPCPYVSCKYNLYLDVSKAGAIKINFPHLEPDEMKDSCVLDMAEAGDRTLDEVGIALNVSRERIRQMWHAAKPALSERLEEVA